MVDFITEALKDFGIWGLLAGLAVEASSLPFPGALITLIYGYLLNSSFLDAFWISTIGSICYTLFSLIPYGIGYKLEDKLSQKWKDKKVFKKSQRWFQKCGQWTIALARPIGVGNYVSYLAGISKIRLLPFLLLTFLGIFPWVLAMILVGGAGNLKMANSIISQAQTYIFVIAGIAIIGFVIYKMYARKKSEC